MKVEPSFSEGLKLQLPLVSVRPDQFTIPTRLSTLLPVYIICSFLSASVLGLTSKNQPSTSDYRSFPKPINEKFMPLIFELSNILRASITLAFFMYLLKKFASSPM